MKFIPALIFLTLLSISISAQDENIRLATELVSVNVAIVDQKGMPVIGLSQNNFQVFDNRSEQKIEYFSAQSAGVTFGIVYDMHPTTDERTNAVLNGLREFSKGLPAQDDVFMIIFNEKGSVSLDFVPEVDQLQRHLASPISREPRSLYDALYQAAEKLRAKKNLKKTLIVVTDAADHASRKSFGELRDALRKLDVQVYAIVLDETLGRFDSYIDMSKNPDERRLLSDAGPADRAALNSITLRSGGGTFASSLENQQNIFRISQQIATEMRRKYTVSFYPPEPSDGKWHSLRIGLRGVPDSKKFALTYRPGYQVTSPEKRP